jgi:hypothetical protein
MKMKKLIALFLIVIAAIMPLTSADRSGAACDTRAFGLKNTRDTVQNAGTSRAVARMTALFYECGDKFAFPLRDIPALEPGETYIGKLSAVYMEAQRQSPYLFPAKTLKFEQGADWVTITRVRYLDDREEKKMIAELEETADKIIAEIIKPNMSDYAKAMAVYNYVRKISAYDYAAAEAALSKDYAKRKGEWIIATSAYGCLIEKSAICEGYAQAVNLLARKAGLKSLLDTGSGGVLTTHAWNKVKIGSRWYAVDSTFSLVFSTREEYMEVAGKKSS